VKLTIVIPVFNEERTVAQAVRRVQQLDLGGLDKEIVIVNDGSSDGTRQALAPFESEPGLRVHHSPVNLGKGSSVRIGFSYATGDLVTIQDADLELDPSEFEHLVKPILDGQADVVYGSRFLGAGRRGELTFYLANRTLAVITNVLYGAHLTDIETCYKVLRRDVVTALHLRASRFEIEPELTAQILKKGFRIVERPIAYNPRRHDEGKKISWKDGFAAISMLVNQRLGS
jgi:glycosyltransferase involved in cell wall biosynthesis